MTSELAQKLHQKGRAIPSLDGLRAISVLIVILGHSISRTLDRIPFNIVFRNGGQGVAVFFVISGFLITHLLLKELERARTIDLKRFYLRRTFRIFPPFYVFLGVVAILALKHVVQLDWPSLVEAFTYTYNYFPYSGAWILAHCWSLAVEEQFYLLWPLCMTLFSRRTNLLIAVGVILASPFLRLATHYAWFSMRARIDFMTHTRLDAIMTGCLLALAVEMKLGLRFRHIVLNPLAVTMAILLMIGDSLAMSHWHGMYLRSIGYTIQNTSIAVILLFAVFRHESLLGRVLNNRVLRHLGTISYSLYLWQELFTGPNTVFRLNIPFPLNLIPIVVCAEASYFLIERPSFVARDYVQQKLFAAHA